MNTFVYLLRHGQVSGEPCLRGVTDDPVTEHGLMQMQQAVCNKEFDVVISSSLVRCSQFATEYAATHNLPLIIEPALEEINFGDWEGLSYSSLFNQKNSPAEQYFANPYLHSIPNGELTRDFDHRVYSAIHTHVQQHLGQRMLIVTHAGVIRSLLAQCLGFGFVDKNTGYLPVKIEHAALILFECFSNSDHQLTLTLSL